MVCFRLRSHCNCIMITDPLFYLVATPAVLLLAQSDNFAIAGRSVVVLDPTEILAKKCVTLATQNPA